MPKRWVVEGIRTSEELNQLSPYSEVLFYRLIVSADDYGAFHANPAIVRSTCFPLRTDDIKIEQIEEWLAELSHAGLIVVYQAEDGRRYLQFCKWQKYQSTRAEKPKYPLYNDNTCKQLYADDCGCSRIRNTNSCSYVDTATETDAVSVTEPCKPVKKKRQAQFAPPTVEEIAAFCKERGNGLDPQKIFDYYSSEDWKDRNGKEIRSWKQKIIAVWERGPRDQSRKSETIDLSWRDKESVTPDDMVEYPTGSGRYRPRWEVSPDG